MLLYTTLGPGRPAPRPSRRGGTRHIGGNTALQQVIGLLRRWRERIRSRRQLGRLCDLDDHILQDIGLTRTDLLREAARPFWR